ncbi:MAG: F0F1 ATP synthase subunit B [Nitriliruptoraceae bacterium]
MLQSITLLAAEEGGIELFPETPELIWGLVAFLLLMAAMMKFVFPRLNETLEERAAAIQGKVEEADAKLQEAEASKRDYEASIADARGEADRILEEARTAAEALREEARNRAEAEATQIIERAQASVASERDRVLQELRGQVGSLSVELAAKIVERELDASTHTDLVDEYIERLTSQN